MVWPENTDHSILPDLAKIDYEIRCEICVHSDFLRWNLWFKYVVFSIQNNKKKIYRAADTEKCVFTVIIR